MLLRLPRSPTNPAEFNQRLTLARPAPASLSIDRPLPRISVAGGMANANGGSIGGKRAFEGDRPALASDGNSRHEAAAVPPPSNNGNSAAETSGKKKQVDLKHIPGISTAWSADEQSLLDELLIKHASEPSIVRYAKIATQLKDKTSSGCCISL